MIKPQVLILYAAFFTGMSAGLAAGSPLSTQQGERVVFIRGGSGTGGFLEGGSDEQLSDINNFSTSGGNHGFGQLAQLLTADGFVVEQVIEAATGPPVNFSALDLSRVSVLVLGSNNRRYTQLDVAAVTDFVAQGGGLLVISDANWGSNWGSAPTSDQSFLDPYGLVMNQDTSTYVSRDDQGDHLVPIDPILSGQNLGADSSDDVEAFDGEGVSPLTVGPTPAGVQVQILARAENNIHVNDSGNSGSFRQAGPDDAALVVAYFGNGAVVGHFDRNTFFNTNGAGTDITRFDNTQYALNIFRFLSGSVPQPYGEPKVNSLGGEARVVATQSPTAVMLGGYGAIPGTPTQFIMGTERDTLPAFGGQLLVGGTLNRLGVGLADAEGNWNDAFDVPPSTVAFTLTFQQIYRDTGDPTGVGLSSAVEAQFLP